MPVLTKKVIDEMLMRMELKEMARKEIQDAFNKQFRSPSPTWRHIEDYKEDLLLYLVSKLIEADNRKGESI